MARTDTLVNFLTDIANAIRNKKGTTDEINASDFDTEIASISTGLTPTGTLSISENGTYDVTDYASAEVDVEDEGVGSRQWWLDVCAEKISFSTMFNGCTSLTTIPQLNTSKGTTFSSMFYGCTSLTTIPQLDTSKGTSFASMFSSCTSLTTIPQLDTSKGTSFTSMFSSCTSLQNISFIPECINKNISFSSSSLLTAESIASIFNGLAEVTSTQTLTLNASNHYTQTQLDSATQKGWTIAGGTLDE